MPKAKTNFIQLFGTPDREDSINGQRLRAISYNGVTAGRKNPIVGAGGMNDG